MKFVYTLILFLLIIPLKGQSVQKDGSILVETVEWNLLEYLITINRMVLDYSIDGNDLYLELAKKYVIECEEFLAKNEKTFTSQELKQAKGFLENKKSLLLKGISITNSPQEAADFVVENLVLKFLTQTVVARDLEKTKENYKNIYK